MNSVKRNLRKTKYHVLIPVLAVLFAFSAIMPVRTDAASAKELNPSVDTVITNVGNYILSVDTDPDYSSAWNVIGLVRSGRELPSGYLDTFYNNTVNYLEENNWQITRAKYSEYSKLIIAMTAIGKDARDVGGHNLMEYLSDFKKVKLQGFNGPIWALIALNSHPEYQIPLDLGAAEQTTEEGLIQYLLSRQIAVSGQEGWTLTGNVPDTDITGMTIQALAPYYGKRDDVTQAVDKALGWLSSAQNSYGGYSTLNGSGSVETSESDDQVIVALSAIGIDCRTDSRFVRPDGSWVMSRLFEYYMPKDATKGGFMHVFPGSDNNGGGAGGTIDGMATEQGMYATVAYRRLLEGKTALYDMSDIDLSPGGAPDTPSTTEAEKETAPASKTTAAKKVKVTKLVLNYKQITLKKGKTRTLKLKIYPANASNKKVKWTSSNKKVATVTQKGKVKAVKAGKATITVTAKDGSKKKASCKVIVKKAAAAKKKSKTKIKVTDVSLNYSQISVAAGEKRDLDATVTPSDASNKKLTWWSSDKKIATVNQSGMVKGIRNGTTTIHVKARDGSGERASCKVIVYGSSQPSSRQTTTSPGPYTTTQAPASTGTQPAATTAKEPSEATTQADAWSFEGDAYVPETTDEETEYEEDVIDEEEDPEAGDEEDVTEQARLELPPWLAILFGLMILGTVYGSSRIPWSAMEDKVLLWLAADKKKKNHP